MVQGRKGGVKKMSKVIQMELFWGTLIVLGCNSQGIENPSQDVPSPNCVRISIPAYFYPGSIWDQAISGAPATAFMTMNPSNGVGESIDSEYVEVVANAQQAGVMVLGYVYTDYGNRSSSIVKSEIDQYKEWYHIDGIFLDEVSSHSEDLPYYQDLYDYILSTPAGNPMGTFVKINPGTVPDEEYMQVADIVVVFEDDFSSYETRTFPDWILTNYPSTRFEHLVINTPPDKFLHAWDLSRERNAAWVYITDDDLDNPWDSLPSYWDDEVTKSNDSCSE